MDRLVGPPHQHHCLHAPRGSSIILPEKECPSKHAKNGRRCNQNDEKMESSSYAEIKTRSRTDGYGDSWVQRQLGTRTVGYRDKRVQMRQLGTGTNGYKWCDKRVQGQAGTSATNGYRDKRVQGCDKRVQGQSGTSATNGYRDKRVQGCDKRVQRQSGTSATNGYSVVRRYIRTCV